MRRTVHSLLSTLSLLLLVWTAASASAEDIAVIAHPKRAGRINRTELAQIYLKKKQFWSDGAAIIPVNRESQNATRVRFDREVFGHRARRLANYWNREYFRGVLPPATLASDEAVRRFVASEPRAIGYIRAHALDDSVAALLVLEVTEP